MTTIKQKLAVSKMVENGGNIGKAMIAAGYSPATAKTPQKLTDSRGWQELIKDYFSDKALVQLHRSLLFAEKVKTYTFTKNEDDSFIKEVIEAVSQNKLVYVRKTNVNKIAYYSSPDYPIRGNALHLVYKVKGLYSATKVAFDDPYENMTDEELDRRIAETEAIVKRYKASQKPKSLA